MGFELWEMGSGNLAGICDSEAEALAAIRQAIEDYGRDYLDSFALLYEDRRGRAQTLAQGASLAARALAAAPTTAA